MIAKSENFRNRNIPGKWIVTVPLWRNGKGVPIDERLGQLEAFKELTGHYAAPFESEEKADSAAYLWSQALGFSVEAKRRGPAISAEDSDRIVAAATK
jgi:hypothetical protein